MGYHEVDDFAVLVMDHGDVDHTNSQYLHAPDVGVDWPNRSGGVVWQRAVVARFLYQQSDRQTVQRRASWCISLYQLYCTVT